MAQVLQLRRGTTAQNDAFTGAVAEVSVDTDRKSLRVHDGSTMGGKEIADLQTAVPLLPAASSVSSSDTVPVIQSGVARKATKTQILNGIVNANVDAAAAIAGTKIAPDFGAQNIRLNDNQYVLWGGNTNGINGNNASNFLAFYTAATERMRIDSSGNVGIGTSSPAARLNVNAASSADGIRVTVGQGSYSGNVVLFGVTGQTNGYQITKDAVNNIAHIWSGTGGAERMRIDSSGNVGIGTSSPASQARLTVAGPISPTTAATTSGNPNPYFDRFDAVGVGSGRIVVEQVTGTFGIYTNASERLRIDASGNVGIGTSSPAALLDVKGQSATDIFHVTSGTTWLAVGVTDNSRVDVNAFQGSGGGARLLAFQSAGGNASFGGNVGIGTNSPATRLHVDGTIRYTNRPAAGTITAIGFDTNGDLRASSSSLRYKHNVEPYAKGLEEVAQLEPVTFNYNGEELVNAGLIVEDLDELGLEEFVLRDSEGTADAIPYGNMVALLINAIKELKVRVEELEAAQ